MYQYHMSEMYHVSPQDFGELVCLSHSWSDLASRCGHTVVYTKSICTVLNQKVVFLKLDTQHFTRKNARGAVKFRAPDCASVPATYTRGHHADPM